MRASRDGITPRAPVVCSAHQAPAVPREHEGYIPPTQARARALFKGIRMDSFTPGSFHYLRGKKIVPGLDRRAPHTTHTHPAAFLRRVVQQGDERELELKALCFAYHSYFGKPFAPVVRFPPPPSADIDSNQMQMQGAE